MANAIRLCVACLFAASIFSGIAAAQTAGVAAPPRILQPEQGDCIVRVDQTDTTTPSVEVEIDLHKQTVARQTVNGRQRLELWIRGPLTEGDELRARHVTPTERGVWSSVVKAGPPVGDQDCTALNEGEDASADLRDVVSATAYVGTAIDNFAPPIVGAYEEKNERRRYIGGVDFEFRVWPRRSVKKDGMQIWIGGETLHGVRTADVDCTAEPKPPVCGDALTATGQNFRFVLKHASSLEAFIQPRLELVTIEPDSPFPIRLYVSGRFGIMMLTEGKNYAAEAHHLGLGLRAPDGKFADSFLEVGWGFRTFGENIPRVAQLGDDQVTMLAHLSYWNITHPQTRDVIRKALPGARLE